MFLRQDGLQVLWKLEGHPQAVPNTPARQLPPRPWAPSLPPPCCLSQPLVTRRDIPGHSGATSAQIDAAASAISGWNRGEGEKEVTKVTVTTGSRGEPKRTLGEPPMAGGGWRCVEGPGWMQYGALGRIHVWVQGADGGPHPGGQPVQQNLLP